MRNHQIAHAGAADHLVGGRRGVLQVARAPALVEHLGDRAGGCRRPPRSCRSCSAASSRRTESAPAGWQCPCRRYPGRCRGWALYSAVESPRLAEANMPREPVICAASSERMSPNMFSVTTTSKSAGRLISCMAVLSTSRSSICNIGVFLFADAVHDLAPHAAGLKHVGLIDAGHLAAALASSLERLAGDALHLILAILEACRRRAGPSRRRRRRPPRRRSVALAEVQASGELAHDHKVDALDDLGLKRGSACSIEDLHGAQVGVQAQALADAQKARLGARAAGSVVSHFGPPTAANSTASAAFAASSVAAGSGSPTASMAAPPISDSFAVEARIVFRADGVEDLHALRDDLRADAIARQQADVVLLRHDAALFQKVIRLHSHSNALGLPTGPFPRESWICSRRTMRRLATKRRHRRPEHFRKMGRSIAGGAAFGPRGACRRHGGSDILASSSPYASRRPYMEGVFAIKCRNCGGPMYSHQQTRSFDCAYCGARRPGPKADRSRRPPWASAISRFRWSTACLSSTHVSQLEPAQDSDWSYYKPYWRNMSLLERLLWEDPATADELQNAEHVSVPCPFCGQPSKANRHNACSNAPRAATRSARCRFAQTRYVQQAPFHGHGGGIHSRTGPSLPYFRTAGACERPCARAPAPLKPSPGTTWTRPSRSRWPSRTCPWSLPTCA